MLQPPPNTSQEAPDPARRFRPLSEYSGTLANRTYLSLRDAIVGLVYRPGEALRKAEICSALGVSRSPVADAILRLSQEGLVDVVPQAGTFVARFSMADLREGAFLRAAIELAAVERLADVMTEAQMVQIRRNIRVQEALVEDGDYAGFYQMDRALHEMLLTFTGFRKLTQVAESAWVNVDRARQLVLPVPGRVAETLDEHRAIVAALEAREGMAARMALQHHLGQLMTFLVPLEQAHPDFFDNA